MGKRIVVVAGEPSGDRLGAQLALELKRRDPDIEIEGVFGAQMIAAGCVQLASMDTLAVMGFVDPILSLPSILRLRSWLIRYILDDPPDLFIGIDAPDFNLGVEEILRRKGILTAHYVSPTVWAWRQGRIHKIKRGVDLMLTLFPFEEQFYIDHKVPVRYTGHPTADLIPLAYDKANAKEKLGYSSSDRVIAVLPGSRNSEMKHMVKLYLETIKICHTEQPNLKFVVPLVQSAYEEYIEFWRAKIIPDIYIKYVIGDSYAVMAAADAALVTSGTATLELMLHKTPMIVAYRTSWINYMIGKGLIKVKYIALPNLLANAPVIPEYIQFDATPTKLAGSLLDLLVSNEVQQQQTDKFIALHKQLQQGANKIAADAITELLNDNSGGR